MTQARKGSRSDSKRLLVFRSEALATALERQDVAAVALALRHGNTIVPLLKAGDPDKSIDSGEVWMYRDPNTSEVALLLFSDAANKPANLPPTVGLYSPDWLRAFLRRHGEDITMVFLDIAGPYPMQASPSELLGALDA
ncbi:dehydrogenase [Luethyella okanaganae]|uniref:Dehydrogenase n=1 Tax=Luethyella okanaganae TaxID=69372 RepID=A0ABW1VH06_9MICO